MTSFLTNTVFPNSHFKLYITCELIINLLQDHVACLDPCFSDSNMVLRQSSSYLLPRQDLLSLPEGCQVQTVVIVVPDQAQDQEP